MKYFKLDRDKGLDQIPGWPGSWSNEGIMWHGNDNYMRGEYSGPDDDVLSSLPDTPPARAVVSASRFKAKLLGPQVYGGLRVARIGLQAKFQAGIASDQDIYDLTLLEAADGMTAGSDIDLSDPSVSLILDFAVKTEKIGYVTSDGFLKFDDEHKGRVIANISINS